MKILRALKEEASKYDLRKISKEATFWEVIEDILSKIFDYKGFASIMGEYKSLDYNFVTIGDVEIGYEIISSYGDKKPLSDMFMGV